MDKKIWGWMAIGVGLIALIVLYRPVLTSPDSYMFGADGDAVKNYFTYAWHVRYDKDWIHFGGTNYPYGDHVCYTDGHPIVSLILQPFDWAKHYPVGTLNMLMLLSQLIGIGVVYLLLSELGIKRYIAGFGALSMVWLQPTMFRMLGHFSLSHVWVIPFALFLFIKYWNSSKSVWLFTLLSYGIAVFFLHPYYGMMISLIPLCIGFSDLVIAALKRDFSIRSVYLISVGIIAPLFYLLFLKLTDTHPQRPDKALGFLLNASSIDDILVPSLPPFKHFMSQIIKVERQNWEGSAYIGIATMFILVIYSITQLVNFKKIRFNANSLMLRLLFAGLFILLFSFGFPFKYGYEHWLNQIPFIEQFRAPGRFAWVFYFIVVSIAFSILNTWCVQLHQNKKTLLAYLLPILVFGLFFSEGFIAQIGTSEKAQKNYNSLTKYSRYNVHENLAKMKGQQFAGIVPVPFFLYGNDYLYQISNYDEQKHTYELAYQSGTPIMASANPRASLDETSKILNFFSPPFVKKEIFEKIKTTDKFYVFNHGGNSDVQHNYYLPRNKSSISMQEEISLYAKLKSAIKTIDTLQIRKVFSDYYKTNFSLKIKFTHGKLQASVAKAIQSIGLDSCKGIEFSKNESYEASVMLFASQIHKASIEFLLEQIKPDKMVIKQTTLKETFNHYGDSAMCRLNFVAPSSNGEFRITLKGMPGNTTDYSYAKFLLRKKTELVIEIDTSSNVKRISRINNFPITL